jgi:glycosyltransferase involved in cell wall biosynthesis
MTLLIVTPLGALPRPSGKVLLTRKFVDGLSLYRAFWKGPVTALCALADRATDNMDNVEVDPRSGPFQLICSDDSDKHLGSLLRPQTLAMSGVMEPFTSLSRRCREAGIPCVYNTETSLATRLQMIRVNSPTPLHAWRRSFRERRDERAQVKAIALAEGLQCNGTPTYSSYKGLTPFPHLYFDTRIEETMLAPPDLLSRRSERFRRDRKLRLLYSGRLKTIKGVDHLPRVASRLRSLNVSFTLDICGDGESLPLLRAQISDLGLGSSVRLRGVLDFKTELVPFVTREMDLFVCCHRQGDPSCTYLETMACGVPLVGYANEAFQGLSEVAGVGRVTPLDRPDELAHRIKSIWEDPESLAAASRRSLEFAREHTFEKTFHRRVERLDRVAERAFARSACQ